MLYVPILVKLAVTGTPLAGAIGVVVVMFAVMLALTHGVSYRMLVNGIRDRIENVQLVKRLERANNTLENAVGDGSLEGAESDWAATFARNRSNDSAQRRPVHVVTFPGIRRPAGARVRARC